MGNIVKFLFLSEEIWQKNNKMPQEKDHSGMPFLWNCCQVRKPNESTQLFVFKGANVYQKFLGSIFLSHF